MPPHATRSPLLMLLLVAPCAAADPVVPTDGMKIAADTTLAPGVYLLAEGLEIVADGVILDGSDAVLISREQKGVGLIAAGRKDITIRNLTVERFHTGILLRDCAAPVITGCRIRGTHEIPSGPVWLDIWAPPDRAYGAAILLHNVRDARIEANDLQHQQNGLSLYNCSRCTLTANNASFNSGWGIHLHASSDNILRENVADWCNRIYTYPQGGYYAGADAAGLLIVVSSSRNVVEKNSFRGGGDGVFIAGYRHPDINAPCNDNVFRENDCSLSPNNAFEATFCSGNRFENNVADKSNYGFWLGYSTSTHVSENKIRENRVAGVAIEHGRSNRISGNVIRRNRTGVELWTDADNDFVKALPEAAPSEKEWVLENVFQQNDVAISLRADNDVAPDLCRGHQLLNNRLLANRVGLRVRRARDLTVRGTEFRAQTGPDLDVEDAGSLDTTGNLFEPAPASPAPSTPPTRSNTATE